jgi:hypothetical protein
LKEGVTATWDGIAFHFYRYGNVIFCFKLAIPVSSKHPLNSQTYPAVPNQSLFIHLVFLLFGDQISASVEQIMVLLSVNNLF